MVSSLETGHGGKFAITQDGGDHLTIDDFINYNSPVSIWEALADNTAVAASRTGDHSFCSVPDR